MLDLGLQRSQIISVCSVNATCDINFCPNLAQICKSSTSLSTQHIRKKPTSIARDECQCIPPWRHPPPEWRFPSWHTSASNWQKWWYIPQTNPYWRWFSSFVSGKVLVPCGLPLIAKHLPMPLHTLYFQLKKLFVDQEFQVHLVVAQHTRWCEPLKIVFLQYPLLWSYIEHRWTLPSSNRRSGRVDALLDTEHHTWQCIDADRGWGRPPPNAESPAGHNKSVAEHDCRPAMSPANHENQLAA